MRAHAINSLDNFVAGWYSDQHQLCSDIISYHAANDPQQGKVGNRVDLAVKDSRDCVLAGDLMQSYGEHVLQPCIEAYCLLYPEVTTTAAGWYLSEPVNIQHYAPNGGFKTWHYERSHGSLPNASRFLVFMTYLNTVTEGGGTQFKRQGTVQAAAGLTLIWPTEWTHTHRGIVSTSQHKWIATGWLSLSGEPC